jgi:uncharacterized surface protein with fasciclin (FAS1) repeats
MRVLTRNTYAALALAAVATFGLAACAPVAEEPMAETPAPAATEEMTEDYTANLVGAGCAGYAEQVPDGGGSIDGMAVDPVATAASNNPILTTLTAALSGGLNPDVNLVDTVNGSDFTVFAPVDDAFAKLPAETVAALQLPENAELLTSILTYHVVPGKILPADIVGDQTTVQGGVVTVAGEGDNLTVNDAVVICGGVVTSNAIVYLIDTVLSPPAA